MFILLSFSSFQILNSGVPQNSTPGLPLISLDVLYQGSVACAHDISHHLHSVTEPRLCPWITVLWNSLSIWLLHLKLSKALLQIQHLSLTPTTLYSPPSPLVSVNRTTIGLVAQSGKDIFLSAPPVILSNHHQILLLFLPNFMQIHLPPFHLYCHQPSARCITIASYALSQRNKANNDNNENDYDT